MNIILTDGDQKHTLGVLRELGKFGHKVAVLTNKKKCLCSYSKFCEEEIILSLDAKKKVVIEELNELSSSYQYLLPIGANSNKFFHHLKTEDGLELKYLRNSKEIFELAFSKTQTLSFAKSIGIPTPKTVIPLSKEIRNFLNDIDSFPQVIKAQKEMGVNVVKFVNSNNQLEQVYNELCKKYHFNKTEDLPIIQEYIEGDGYGYFALVKNGEILLDFQHKRLREYPITGGMSTCAESNFNEDVKKYGSSLLQALKWNGIAMVEFKMNRKGEPILMEINPKFWGSYELASYCDRYFAHNYVNILANKNLTIIDQIWPYKKFQWFLHGDLQTMLTHPKRFIATIRDLCNPRVGSNFPINDMPGNIGIIRNLIEKVLNLR